MTNAETTVSHVRSADGTRIAVERVGAGPGLPDRQLLRCPARLHAPASGLTTPRLALFEPSVGTEVGRPAESDFTTELKALTAAGRHGHAVDTFLAALGVPSDVIAQMTPVRSALEAVAHTLVYDCVISDAASFGLVRSVSVPTLGRHEHAVSARPERWIITSTEVSSSRADPTWRSSSPIWEIGRERLH